MGYYRGDYYRGDYYRGDPGIFSSIGKFVGGVARTAIATVTGGPLAGIKTGLGQIASAVSGTPRMLPAPSLQQVGAINLGGGGGPQYGLVNIAGGGGAPAGDHPAGYHWSKRAQKYVKNRHMNPGNGRAVRRALRRARAFEHLARGVLTIVHGKRPKLKFKRGRKR